MKALIWMPLFICLPLRVLIVTSGFGCRLHPLNRNYAFHEGVDLRARRDTVFAVFDGEVTKASYGSTIGIFARITSGDHCAMYGHLSCLFVTRGDSVYAGQPIGITGATGKVTGEHLHFAIQRRGQFIDPLQFLYKSLIKNEYEQEF
jgi:murein DD-endopeptidase MepM/ murein hydrolase activator NlpD